MSRDLDGGSVYSSLEDVVLNGGLSALQLAVTQFGHQINTQGSNGNTPLHHAVGTGSPEKVNILLKAGAAESLNTRNERYETPLKLAEIYANTSDAQKENAETIVEMLRTEEQKRARARGEGGSYVLAGGQPQASRSR